MSLDEGDGPFVSFDEDDGTFVWITKDGTDDSGSEAEFMIAVHLGDVRGVEYDSLTGMYCWIERAT